MPMQVAGPVRGTYNAEGRFFAVAGNTLFQITTGGISVPLGTVPGVGRVSFSHNQITNGNEILVNNGNSGYIYNTVKQIFQRITDTSYPGGLRAVFINNRFVQIEPARRYLFNSALADGLSYTALDRFTSETSPDLAMGIESIGNQLAVFSSTTTEWFEDTGANPQPFRSTGIVADKGAAGPFATAKMDNQLFFLADDGVFYRYQGYSPVRISTKPIEQAIRNKNWFNVFTTVWEDSGYAVCYWTFPDGHTWGYDASAGKWHRRESYGLNRWRLNSLTYWQNAWYGGDFQNGRLWQLDWDYLLEGDQEFESIRACGVIADNQNRVIHERLELVMNTGMVETTPVDFVDQPEGPIIVGEAPDGIVGDAYTYTYTVTPGDAPIARTIIVSGTLLPGLSWNQSTATLSGTPTTAGTMTLTIRTIDQNGLFDELVDVIPVVAYEVLLVTGSDSGEGFVFARGRTLEVPTFEGLLTSTGADLVSGSGGFYGGVWTVNGVEECRYSEDDMETWETGDIPINTHPPRRIAGGASGWLASISVHAAPQPTYVKAPLVPAAYIPYTFDRVISEVEEAPVGFLSMIRYTDGYYYVDQDGSLMRSVDLENNWELVGGYRPDGIVWFRDAIVFNDELYVTCQQYIDGDLEQPARYQLRRWNGSDFSTILIDNVTPTSIQPWQLEAGNGVLLVYCWGGNLVYTSANDFEEPIDTGIRSATAATIQDESKGRQIVFAGGYFYLISGSGTDPALNNKVVVTTDGLTFGDPVAPPVSALISISSSAEPS